jgi:hypothetical protein
MKLVMKSAVDRVYALLLLKNEDLEQYESRIQSGERYTTTRDEPEMPEGFIGSAGDQRIARSSGQL